MLRGFLRCDFPSLRIGLSTGATNLDASDNVISGNEPSSEMQDLSRSLEINIIWTLDTEFPASNLRNEMCRYCQLNSCGQFITTRGPFHKGSY